MNYFQRLKDVREDNDLNQVDVAKLLGIQQTHYSRYERGKMMMGIDKYIKLAKFYNVSIDYLAGVTDIPRTLDGTPFHIRKKVKFHDINISGGNNNFEIH